MNRLLWMSPLLLFSLLYLSLFITGLPLLARSLPITSKLPPGNGPTEEPLSDEATAATSELVRDPHCRAHNLQGHGMGVAGWLLLPLAAVLPLAPAWRRLRRRKTALAATLVPLLLVLLLLLLESFSGYMLAKMFRSISGVNQGPFMRFSALHSLMAPLLIVLLLGFLLWVQGRLSKRAAAPDAPGSGVGPQAQ
jgi:hypothetical protein